MFLTACSYEDNVYLIDEERKLEDKIIATYKNKLVGKKLTQEVLELIMDKDKFRDMAHKKVQVKQFEDSIDIQKAILRAKRKHK